MPVERHYWIQIEGGPGRTWNMAPTGKDRMHDGPTIPTGGGKGSVIENVLILRRYRPPDAAVSRGEWKEADDRKVNPWDMNEEDPSITEGTIPGPTLECNVGRPGDGEDIIVHFRNNDERKLPSDWSDEKKRLHGTHSLHPHGIVFPAKYDGAYPFTPPDDPNIAPGSDPDDPVNRITDDERDKWAEIGVSGEFKQGDRVPQKCTFTYRWRTFGWPSTAGVWLYHDHSVKDVDNVRSGAIGFLVIHNPDDVDDVFIDWDNDEAGAAPFLPEGKLNGNVTHGTPARFRKPPAKALYLQLYHELNTIKKDGGTQRGGMAINGRFALGNTPTMVGGLETKMRFGLVAMNLSAHHTFHLHGHRWVIPGPSGDKVGGTTPGGGGVQASALNKGVSQFEDTKIFGAANAFSFTINQGSFMGPPLAGGAVGEWHMHCHVLAHMMKDHLSRMMGSLVIIGDDEPLVEDILLKPIPHHDNDT